MRITSSATMDRVLIVFGADKGQADRLRELTGYTVQRAAEPAALSRILAEASDRSMPNGSGATAVGLVFDLTTLPRVPRLAPIIDDTGSGRAARHIDAWEWAWQPMETGLAWFCGGLLVSSPHLPHLPMIIVSCDGTLAMMLRSHGVATVAHLHPDNDDVAWRFALEGVLAAASSGMHGLSSPHAPDCAVRWRTDWQADDWTAPREALYLHAQAWVDLARCLIWVGDCPVALTGREVRVLEILARAPGRFYPASAIAQEISPASFEVEAHCIEQTISGLRHKLGETARAPRAIVSRRGLGYALIIESRAAPWRRPELLNRVKPRRTNAS